MDLRRVRGAPLDDSWSPAWPGPAVALSLSLLLLASISPRPVLASGTGDAGRWVLPPAAGPALQTHLEGLPPGWRLQSAALNEASVELRLISPAGEEHSLTFLPPDHCPDPPPPGACLEVEPSARAALGPALEHMETLRLPWRRLGPTRPAPPPPAAAVNEAPPPERTPPPPPPPPHHFPPLSVIALLLGLTISLSPLGLGLLIERRCPPERRPHLATLLFALPALCAALAPFATTLSAWDLLFFPSLVAGGWALGRMRPSRSQWLLLLSSLAVFFGGAELLTRGLQIPGDQLETGLFQTPLPLRSSTCQTWLQPPDQTFSPERRPSPMARRRVLHIGDSMVHGLGVRREQSFPTLLNQPGVDEHFNLGVPGVAPDIFLHQLRRWTPTLRPTHAVIYLLPFNDLWELREAQPCCDGEPFLRYPPGGGVEQRCEAPAPVGYLSSFRAAAPFWGLRLLSHGSHFAAALARRWTVPSGVFPPPNLPGDFEKLGRILVALRDIAEETGIEISVVVLPHGEALMLAAQSAGPPPDWVGRASEEHQQVIATAQRAGLPVFDAWPPISSARSPSAALGALFCDPVHLSIEGHAVLADWLASEVLGPIGPHDHELP